MSHFSAFYYFSLGKKINDCPLLNHSIGNVLHKKKNPQVLSYYEKVHEFYPKDPEFVVRLCISNIVNAKTSKAKEVLKEQMALNPTDDEIASLKGC